MRACVLLSLLAASIVALPARADTDIPIPGYCANANSVVEVLANAVTDRIYVHCAFSTLPSTLVEIDAATHAQRSIAFAGRLRIVDPIRNRVIAAPRSLGQPLEVLDVPSWTVTTVATGLVPNLALDPVDGSIWLGNVPNPSVAAGELWRLDPAGGAPTIVPLPGQPTGVAIDASTRRVYATVSLHTIVEVDAVSLATRSITVPTDIRTGAFPVVDPVRALLFVPALDGSATPVVEIVDTAAFERLSPLAFPDFAPSDFFPPVAIDPGFDRLWVRVNGLDGDDNSLIWVHLFGVTSLTESWPDTLSALLPRGELVVSPATGRVYVTDHFDGFPYLVERDGSPPGGVSLTVWEDLSRAGPSAALLSSNRLYFPAWQGSSFRVREHDEIESAPIPLDVAISTDPLQPGADVAIHFEATSSYPTPPPIARIYYQVDSVDGAWSAASPPGASASATLDLPPGPHVVHAFAMDGQESAVGCSACRNSVTGPVASIEITVPEPPACSNGIDDDGDSLADYPADPGCYAAVSVRENPECDNGIDDDGDAAVDHPADARCRARWDNDELRDPSGCGIGAEIAFALAALARARRFAIT